VIQDIAQVVFGVMKIQVHAVEVLHGKTNTSPKIPHRLRQYVSKPKSNNTARIGQPSALRG